MDFFSTSDYAISKTVLRNEEAVDSGIGTENFNLQDISELPSTYPVVALGGTFDHLHSGHKILLSMGAWIAETKLIVGVTGEKMFLYVQGSHIKLLDDILLQKKSNRHLLESLSFRMERVRSFLKLFKPKLICDTVTISDVYGPTAEEPDIQALVVSKETESGAAASKV